MDVRRSINTKIWSDEWFESLDQKEKLLWIYLLTNSHTNMLGVYEISPKKISFETGLAVKDILKAFEGFERVRKGYYYNQKYVVLVNWIKNQSMNDNMVTSASNLYDALHIELKDIMLSNGFKGFERVSKAFRTVPKKEKEIEKRKGSVKSISPNGEGIKPGMVL